MVNYNVNCRKVDENLHSMSTAHSVRLRYIIVLTVSINSMNLVI